MSTCGFELVPTDVVGVVSVGSIRPSSVRLLFASDTDTLKGKVRQGREWMYTDALQGKVRQGQEWMVTDALEGKVRQGRNGWSRMR